MSNRSRIIKKTFVPAADGIALIRSQGEDSGPTADLTVHRREGKVVALEIHCACGRTVLVDCIYEEPVENRGAADGGNCMGINK